MAGYSCAAENKVGTVEKHFSLTVQGKASPLPLYRVSRENKQSKCLKSFF